MLLHTPLYLVFLVAVAALYWLLRPPAWRKGWLLAASYAFYALFDWRFAVLLLAVTLAAYAIGRALPGSRRPRALLTLSVAINLGTLGLFKYADFFLSSVSAALPAAGLPHSALSLRLILPLGISFYTFQAIAYTAEVYRGKAAPVTNFVDLALYLVFFPKLIAGPLVRPQAFLGQLAAPASRPDVGGALQLLLLGLFKKVVIADSLGMLADTAFRAANLPGDPFSTPLYLQGFYLYAFQIYADFSGYTDIARASAGLLGFDLPENFRQPYLAVSLTDFWNRWHMSLTQWFREYLFFPLSRGLLSRLGRDRASLAQILANLVTMTLIGLWHGAAWTFVLWGLWHGMLLTGERLLRYRPAGRWRQWAAGLVTFHVVALGWVLFRADSLESAGRFVAGLVSFWQMQWLGYYLPSILLTVSLVLALDLAAARQWSLPGSFGRRWRPVFVIAAITVVASLGILGFVRGAEARPFIYGQF